MKYIIFILKSFCMFIFQLFFSLMGIFIIPFFLKRVESFVCDHEDSFPSFRFKDKWIEKIFGNSEDGVDGDKPYKTKYNNNLNLWTRYNWVAFRNPIHNLALSMGVNETIISYSWVGNRYTEDKIGHEGFVYSEAIGASEKIYPMYRWCKILFKNYGIEANFGYKNFNIIDFPKFYKYSFTVSINPFKKFEV